MGLDNALRVMCVNFDYRSCALTLVFLAIVVVAATMTFDFDFELDGRYPGATRTGWSGKRNLSTPPRASTRSLMTTTIIPRVALFKAPVLPDDALKLKEHINISVCHLR